MENTVRWSTLSLVGLSLPLFAITALGQSTEPQIGREVAITRHLQDGEEFDISLRHLMEFGSQLFNAKFTIQEGAGRPQSKGTGAPISDSSSPLVFPRNFDRISSPEANACSGCHNAPVSGAGGDRVTEVFVLAQRFDRLTFDHNDGSVPTAGIETRPSVISSETLATRKRLGLVLAVAGLLVVLAAGYWTWFFLRTKSSPEPFQSFAITRVTDNGKSTAAAISPDGKYILSIVNDNGKKGLFLRHLATNSNTQVVASGSEDYNAPSFSPDGNYFYFLAARNDASRYFNLMRAPVLGGTPQLVAHNVNSPALFSPDPKRIAYGRWNRRRRGTADYDLLV